MILEGKAWKYGKNIDTDVIIPARYLNTSEPAVLGQHCLEDLDSNFVARVRPGDVLVAEDNFGCGSSREHAPIAIKAAGISAVIANSFARIFYRNAINIGLPIVESPEAVNEIETGDDVRVDLEKGTIEDLTKGTEYQVQPFPQFVQELIDQGGLIEKIRREKQLSRNGE